MYNTLRRFYYIAVLAAFSILFALISLAFAPGLSFLWFAILAAVLFIMLSQAADWTNKITSSSLYRRLFEKGDTRYLNTFLTRLRICFTTNELIGVIQRILEEKADCAALYMNMKNRYSIYNSPARVSSDPETFKTIVRQYSQWKDGIHFFSEDFGLTGKYKKTRGFFMVYGDAHLYIFARYTKLYDKSIYDKLYAEFKAYLEREKTIERMFVISALSKEWELVAETQKSFLPKRMPDIVDLEIASYYRPLVNVSGDYYDVLKLDDHRALLVLGDVSGKGLGAALIMGIIVNTIKISENKTVLDTLVRAIDTAIKAMRFEDKYTVLFLGLIDTEARTLRYVNASMSDPLIVSQGPEGPVVKALESTSSLVGIIQLDEIGVEEVPIQSGDLVIIASDGVTEVTNKEGVQLSDNKLYLSTIKRLSTDSSAQETVDAIADMVLTYNGDKKLRDDVTMLVAKVK